MIGATTDTTATPPTSTLLRPRAAVAPPKDLREEVIKVLADLLLEALGEETDPRPIDHGGGDESEGHA